ncbi:MAG: hypothetical protein C4536_06730 [Actinobacteria bacterium]|jgi:alkylation response protein AidB-like acyl-CoA dehydrogenase|nr:MAG: hypothetical protein C4536_06730 [Actinomycetota bacterium]
MITDVRFEDEANVIRKVCRDFCRKEIEVSALELDAHYDLEKLRGILVRSVELEILTMLIPEEYGGVGSSVLAAAQVLDELAYGCAGVATIFAYHLAALVALIEGGKEELLKELSAADSPQPTMLTLAGPDMEEREDAPQLVEAKNGLMLKGVIPLVASASLADRMVVFVREADAGLTQVLVDPRAKGVSVQPDEELLGLHTVPFADVVFDGCLVGDADLVGERGKAEQAYKKARAALNVFVAAIAMGTSRLAYSRAYDYAQQRWQFGRMLVDHDEIRRMLANMVTKISMGTAGYSQALKVDGTGTVSSWRSDLAKIFCTDAALEIAVDAIQIFGGHGYMKEQGLEKIMRDAKMLQVLPESNRYMEVQLFGAKG